MFDTVLVANRGEIACRVIRSVQQAGLHAVAVYSDADRDAPHVGMADTAVRLGPAEAAESYLSIDRVLAAAAVSGAGAVHPGYGFLSENADFAAACESAGLIFIGPPASAIEEMGDKITARDTVESRGVPTVPGISYPGLTDEQLIAGATGADGGGGVAFPVLIKPSAGGGGKGMHVVATPDELPETLATARREAASTFGDDTVFIEHFVASPRHIEVQIVADSYGTVIHLGERECSLQRRHQKVIEEAPSVLLDTGTRARIGEAACDAARACGYRGVGTVEFIVSADRPDTFFFMEMNTRLQVEHPVTELVTGVDLVDLQLLIAQGGRIPLSQDEVTLTGHAIEARVYAEDPSNGFLPTGGTITALRWPSGPGVRVDDGVTEGQEVTSYYDPMLAKIIAHGADREQARVRLDSALAHTLIDGPVTNIGANRFLLANESVRTGELDTGLIDRVIGDMEPPPVPAGAVVVAALEFQAQMAVRADVGRCGPWAAADGWRLGGAPAPFRVRLAVPGVGPVDVGLSRDGDQVAVTRDPVDPELRADPPVVMCEIAATGPGTPDTVRILAPAGERTASRRWVSRAVPSAPRGDGPDGQSVAVSSSAGTWVFSRLGLGREAVDQTTGEDNILSPMPGTVVEIRAREGDMVTTGQPLIVLEAMKMEHSLAAPHDGTVSFGCDVGDRVGAGVVLVSVTAPAMNHENA